MSRFNTDNSHPLIPTAREYMIEQRIVSIHSEDRNMAKYPNSSDFEIELPDDYLNVSTVKLGTYTFPANYNTFSLEQSNIVMSFKFSNIYNPADYGYFNPLLDAIFNIIYPRLDNEFYVFISEGFYTPTQIAKELTNRFNDIVDQYILSSLTNDYPDLVDEYNSNGGYNQFIVIFNSVSQDLWFGNKSSGFIITNSSSLYTVSKLGIQTVLACYDLPSYESYSTWGLPAYLGFSKCDTPSNTNILPGNFPRFFYGDAIQNSGDNGYWLLPDPSYIGLQYVNYLEAPFKINILGKSYMYMEIDGLNCIDELVPYQLSSFTTHTNESSGIHNSAFAKIAVTTTPTSQWFDNNTEAVKIFMPPAERIRKIKVKIRYHDGKLVQFGNFNYSFNLIFQILRPQTLRSYMTFDPAANSISGVSNVIAKR
jgi:hypothetical protein